MYIVMHDHNIFAYTEYEEEANMIYNNLTKGNEIYNVSIHKIQKITFPPRIHWMVIYDGVMNTWKAHPYAIHHENGELRDLFMHPEYTQHRNDQYMFSCHVIAISAEEAIRFAQQQKEYLDADATT